MTRKINRNNVHTSENERQNPYENHSK